MNTAFLLLAAVVFPPPRPPSNDIRIENRIPVRMRDGVVLYADVYRPVGDGKYPVLVSRTPYSTERAPSAYAPAVFFARRGYVFVFQDVRGRHESEGGWKPFLQEQQDGYDTIEWAARQPWSNGKVGMQGASYLGHVQWQAAMTRPPSLAAIFPNLAPTSIYHDTVTLNGAFRLSLAFGWGPVRQESRVMQNTGMHTMAGGPDGLSFEKILWHLPLSEMPKLAGRKAGFWDDWLRHPEYDDYWRAASVEEVFDRIQIPVHTFGGWFDILIQGTLRGYQGVKGQRRMVVGPWGHGPSRKYGDLDFGEEAYVDPQAVELRWFDYTLKGLKNGLDREPPVKIFTMGVNRWQGETRYPLERTEYRKLYFHSAGRPNSYRGDGRLSWAPPAGDSPPARYRYDPDYPVPSVGGNNCCGAPTLAGPVDQGPVESRNDVLVYTSDFLDQPLDVTGPVKVVLHAASDAASTDFVAKLVDVYPDGKAYNMAEGVHRARGLPRDQAQELTIDLVGTSVVFQPGHRIRVSVTSSHFPQFDRQPRAANQRVFATRNYASHIVLPVIPRGRDQLATELTSIGLRQLAERDRVVAQITTREALERRKQEVREKILRLIGGLPERRGPLNPKQVGVLERPGYRIEKVIFESLPGFYVTANVYVPVGQGPFPAILMPVGHGADGKASRSHALLAAGLALKGFVALTYDPIGQGERSQYWDPEKKASRVGGPTAEHSYANGQMMLIGDNVARYRIWDGIRGLDYLVSRPDVDPERLGCTGCSGGGTVTTYLAALDGRIKVAAPACYITTWQELLTKLGPQDGEQSFPGFLKEGLNMSDYVALFAPKPYLIVSTTEDFFPIAGAREVYEEAKRFYRLYGAEEKIRHQVGPGGHGVPQVNREGIYAWFQRWLGKPGDPKEPPIQVDSPETLRCTPTGQVGGETVYTLTKKRAADLIPPGRKPDRTKLSADIRELTGIERSPGGSIPPGRLLMPPGAGRKPAVLVLDPQADLEGLARQGNVVLALEAWEAGGYGLAMRAAVVGKTLVGLRAGAILQAVDYLASRPEAGEITALARGPLDCVALLHAALLEERLRKVTLAAAPNSFRELLERPNYEVAIPGVLRRYDLLDIAQVINYSIE